MGLRRSVCLWSCLVLGWATRAQDIQFSQFYAVPVYQNPAFAGSSYLQRFTFHQRLQWMALDARYVSSMVAWDGHFDRLRGGLGLMALRDYQGGDKITSTEWAAQYAYEVPLSEKYVLRAGVQYGMGWRTVDYTQFRYAQDHTNDGFQGTTYNQYGNNTFYYQDIGSGLVLFSEKLWLGAAAHHMNQPKQTFYNNTDNRLPMKISFTGGYKWVVKRVVSNVSFHERAREYTLIPTFQYKLQGKSDQLDLGIYTQVDRALLGLWYRGIPFKRLDAIQNNESLIALLGLKYHNLVFAYSYDFTVSRLSRAITGGSHELNITLYFDKKKEKRKPMKRLPCPDFFD